MGFLIEPLDIPTELKESYDILASTLENYISKCSNILFSKITGSRSKGLYNSNSDFDVNVFYLLDQRRLIKFGADCRIPYIDSKYRVASNNTNLYLIKDSVGKHAFDVDIHFIPLYSIGHRLPTGLLNCFAQNRIHDMLRFMSSVPIGPDFSLHDRLVRLFTREFNWDNRAMLAHAIGLTSSSISKNTRALSTGDIDIVHIIKGILHSLYLLLNTLRILYGRSWISDFRRLMSTEIDNHSHEFHIIEKIVEAKITGNYNSIDTDIIVGLNGILDRYRRILKDIEPEFSGLSWNEQLHNYNLLDTIIEEYVIT